MNSSPRFYLDYNATSPLSCSVKEWLAKGDFPWANPASTHQSGREAKKFVRQTHDFLKQTFERGPQYHLFFHSGATEGINTLLKGAALKATRDGLGPLTLFYGITDHRAVINSAEECTLLGHKAQAFSVLPTGELDFSQLLELVQKTASPVLVNWTWVNNETGVVWPLEWAQELKRQTGCFIHVDAVQAPGKIPQFTKLLELDAYTFSGHKFGALKGVGFSFVRQDYAFVPLIHGGNQQDSLRAGTENVMGTFSLKLALEELIREFDHGAIQSLKEEFEHKLLQDFPQQLEIIGHKAKSRNVNTINLLIKGKKADSVMAALDLAGLEVSSGSACSSGSLKPNRVLLALGRTEAEAKSSIRLSFPPHLKQKEAQEIYQRLSQVLRGLLKSASVT